MIRYLFKYASVPGFMALKSVWLTNTIHQTNFICIKHVKLNLKRCVTGTFWWLFSSSISTFGSRPVKRKEHSHRLRSTSSKKNSKRQVTEESKTHPHFWESCWSEFGEWYVMLVGLLKQSRYNCMCSSIQGTVNLSLPFWYTMRIHGLWVWRLTVPKIGVGAEWAGVWLSYLKLHYRHCSNSVGILYQSGCSLSWSAGLTMIWEKVNRHYTMLSLMQMRPVVHGLHASLHCELVKLKKL